MVQHEVFSDPIKVLTNWPVPKLCEHGVEINEIWQTFYNFWLHQWRVHRAITSQSRASRYQKRTCFNFLTNNPLWCDQIDHAFIPHALPILRYLITLVLPWHRSIKDSMTCLGGGTLLGASADVSKHHVRTVVGCFMRRLPATATIHPALT